MGSIYPNPLNAPEGDLAVDVGKSNSPRDLASPHEYAALNVLFKRVHNIRAFIESIPQGAASWRAIPRVVVIV